MRPQILLDEITQDVREYAARQEAESGMEEKSREFREKGSEIYLAETPTR